ncbi:hypothetical protein LA080_004250 [Diaporthe eres]|nr:hypothetical protein LA080_004250 [Diaporthe eres]
MSILSEGQISEKNDPPVALAVEPGPVSPSRVQDVPEHLWKVMEKARDDFIVWLERDHGMFHISGKPGSGKSTLMKYLCQHRRTKDHLEAWAGDKNLSTGEFFFWRPGSTLQKSLKGIIRGLLHCVLSEAPDLIPVFAFFIDGLDEFNGNHSDLVHQLFAWRDYPGGGATDPNCGKTKSLKKGLINGDDMEDVMKITDYLPTELEPMLRNLLDSIPRSNLKLAFAMLSFASFIGKFDNYCRLMQFSFVEDYMAKRPPIGCPMYTEFVAVVGRSNIVATEDFSGVLVRTERSEDARTPRSNILPDPNPVASQSAELPGAALPNTTTPSSPLAFLDSLQSTSGSASGAAVDQLIRWDDNADLSQVTSLPHIPVTPFNILCHIGAVVIEDGICGDRSLTVAEKLLAGRIFEHAGKSMPSTKDAHGKSMQAGFVRQIAALNFVGHTHMDDDQLDNLLRELLRVNRNMSSRPAYRPLYWNCHDIGCRFAYLAIGGDADISLIQHLSGIFERAKFRAQGILSSATMQFINVTSSPRVKRALILPNSRDLGAGVFCARQELVEYTVSYLRSKEARDALLTRALEDRSWMSELQRGAGSRYIAGRFCDGTA